MEEQIIKIKVPEGKIAKYNETTSTVEFIDKEPIKSKSWKEFCKNHPDTKGEWYIQNDSAINMWGYYTTSDRRDIHRNNLETEEDAEGILALIQLTRLHDEWVGDWRPDHRNYQYVIKVEGKNRIIISNFIQINNLLAFPSYGMAEEFLGCFRDLIEKAKKFI